MSLIKKGGTFPMEKVVLSAGGDVEITDPNGKVYNPITTAHTRQYYRSLQGRTDETIVCIYDALLDVEYWSEVNKLKDSTGEVDASGTVTIAGVAGSVNGITVNGVELMTASVAFIVDLATTAAAVVSNINAGPERLNYVASSVGAIITITSLAYNNTDTNGFIVVAITTTLTTIDVNMAGGVTSIISDIDPATDKTNVTAYLGAFIGK